MITARFIGLLVIDNIIDHASVVGTETIIVDCNGNGNYTTIQEAIDNASIGDTINVWAGVYNENIIINKTLTLIGNGSKNTTINSGPVDTVFITSDWVNISGFNIKNNGGLIYGIKVRNAENVSIINNNCSSCGYGITLYYSNYCRILNNTCNLNNRNGIYLYDSTNNSIINNNCSENNYYGISIQASDSNKIINNNCTFNGRNGIEIGSKSILNKVNNNTCIRNDDNGILIASRCNSNQIQNNTCLNNHKYGIELYFSNSNKIQNNICYYNFWDGIYIHNSAQNNLVEENNCSNNYNTGINLYLASQNTITNNSCFNNYESGIRLSFLTGVKLYNNTISNNSWYGVYLEYSNSIKMLNNSFFSCGIFIEGDDVEHWDTHTIDINNTVNGKPIYYVKNTNDMVVPLGAGQIILANSWLITIKDQNINDAGVGILLGFSDYNIIESCKSDSNNRHGIYLYQSNFNRIANSTTYRNLGEGIFIHSSSSNTVFNTISKYNGWSGIFLVYADDNNLNTNVYNFNNEHGIDIGGISESNYIINNNCSQNVIDGIITYSDNNFMINNTCIENHNGIYIGSSYNTVFKNICNFNLDDGMYVDYGYNMIMNNTCLNNLDSGMNILSYENSIEHNNCSNNANNGIIIYRSDTNTINSNNCSYNGENGIWIEPYSDSNTVTFNNCSNNKNGINISHQSNSNVLDENICLNNNENGITITEDSKYNKIKNNTCTSNNIGIFLSKVEDSTIEQNICSNNSWDGIRLFYMCKDNTLIENLISNNFWYGISAFSECFSNAIFHNIIDSNYYQAYDRGYNAWYNIQAGGNYWSDYYGLDNGDNDREAGDGIGDTDIPHLGLDYFPFVNPYGWRAPKAPVLSDPGDVNTKGEFILKWNSSINVDGFVLEEDDNIDFSSPLILYHGYDDPITQLVNHSIFQFTVSGKTDGQYFYRVKSHKKNYYSTWSNYVNITIDLDPITPINLTVTVWPGGNALNISWDVNKNKTAFYELYVKSIGSWHTLTNISHPNTKYDHTNLTDEVMYYYKIRAWANDNRCSKFSDYEFGIPNDLMPPDAPQGLRVINRTFNSLNITWAPSKADDVMGYNIYQSKTSEPVSWEGPINGEELINATFFLDTGLDEGTTYYYVITAVDEVPNESPFSNVVHERTYLVTEYIQPPEINQRPGNISIAEDSYDDSSIRLYKWFKDVNDDTLIFQCEGQVHINVTIYQNNGTVILQPEKNWNGQEVLVFYVSDGIHNISDYVLVTVLAVSDLPEIPQILSPEDGARFEKGTQISLHGTCDDPDLPYGDVLKFTWMSSISGELGRSDLVRNLNLPVGEHKIILIVTDSENLTSSSTITITIFEPEKSEATDSMYLTLGLYIGIGFVILIFIIIIFQLFLIRKKKASGEQIQEEEDQQVQPPQPLPIGSEQKKRKVTVKTKPKTELESIEESQLPVEDLEPIPSDYGLPPPVRPEELDEGVIVEE